MLGCFCTRQVLRHPVWGSGNQPATRLQRGRAGRILPATPHKYFAPQHHPLPLGQCNGPPVLQAGGKKGLAPVCYQPALPAPNRHGPCCAGGCNFETGEPPRTLARPGHAPCCTAAPPPDTDSTTSCRVLQGHCRAVPPLAAGFLSFYPPGRASCHKQNRKCRCKSAKKVPAITSAGTFYFTITRTEGAYLYRVSNFLRYS